VPDVVITTAVRTPIGKFLGKLSSYSAVELGVQVVRQAVARTGLSPAVIGECILGNVLQSGLGQNPARQAARKAGVPDTTPAFTVNYVCGSGLKAVALAAQAITTVDAEIVVAGGMESMSNAPYLLPKARTGYKMGDGTIVHSMIRDGLWDVYNDYHMGRTAENIAAKFGISRAEQDAHAAESHRRATEAIRQGWFREQIVPLPSASSKGGNAELVDSDESVRPDTSEAALAKLKPVFEENGTVTAGNASGISDGAAAVLVMSAEKAKMLNLEPLAYIRGQASTGIDPAYMGLAPISGVTKRLEKVGWKPDEVGLFELNEAFSVHVYAVMRELQFDPEKVNVYGGAVALGHPIGASGCRVLTTLLYALKQRNPTKGVAALCMGGGNSVALAVERVAR
jgi:acetyl-CoA C-acetyltransferase